jgi:hypothetical protein
MAHYTFLDDNNLVTEVIVGKEEFENGIDWEIHYGNFRNKVCKRTSYNTIGGIHYNPITNQPSEDQIKAFRKNYAGIGYYYDNIRDAFIPPKPFPSWTLDEFSCLWQSPIPYPNDGNMYEWNEETLSWDLANT